MRALFPALMAVLIAVTPVLADKGGRGDDDDRRTLERAQENGNVLPLTRIVELLREQGIAGDILEVELEGEGEDFVYEIYVLGPDGRRLELKVDPVTGRILDKGRD